MKAKSKPMAKSRRPPMYGVDIAPRLTTLKVTEPPVRAAGIKVGSTPFDELVSKNSKRWELQDMKTLVWVEHDGSAVKDATLSAVTCRWQAGRSPFAGRRPGRWRGGREAAAKIAGVGKVHVADDAAYRPCAAENVAPLVAEPDGPATTRSSHPPPRPARTSPRASRRCSTSCRFPKSCRSKAPKPSPARSMRATRSPPSNRATQAGHHRARHRVRQGRAKAAAARLKRSPHGRRNRV